MYLLKGSALKNLLRFFYFGEEQTGVHAECDASATYQYGAGSTPHRSRYLCRRETDWKARHECCELRGPHALHPGGT